jgi:hypothetical protein
MNKIILTILCASLSLPVISETFQMRVNIGSVIENSVFPVAASSVPDGEDIDEITFIQDTVNISNWELCYDTSVDPITAAAFHAGCDGKGATVFIAEYNDIYYGAGITRFAGYSPIDWGLPTGYHAAPSARLFNLLTEESFSPTGTNPSSTVYTTQAQGIAFGGGNDVAIIDSNIGSYPYGYCFGYTFNGWTSEDCSGGDWRFHAHPSVKVYAVN